MFIENQSEKHEIGKSDSKANRLYLYVGYTIKIEKLDKKK